MVLIRVLPNGTHQRAGARCIDFKIGPTAGSVACDGSSSIVWFPKFLGTWEHGLEYTRNAIEAATKFGLVSATVLGSLSVQGRSLAVSPDRDGIFLAVGASRRKPTVWLGIGKCGERLAYHFTNNSAEPQRQDNFDYGL